MGVDVIGDVSNSVSVAFFVCGNWWCCFLCSETHNDFFVPLF